MTTRPPNTRERRLRAAVEELQRVSSTLAQIMAGLRGILDRDDRPFANIENATIHLGFAAVHLQRKLAAEGAADEPRRT